MFGAQLLAKAAGATIIKSPIKEIGFFDITLSAEGKKDLLFRDVDDSFNVFQWHGDMFNVPAKGIHLAGNRNCVNQAFKIGEKITDPLSMYLSDIFTVPVNLAGLPALSLPCGKTQKGLPVGLQIIGKAFDEETIFQVGQIFENL